MSSTSPERASAPLPDAAVGTWTLDPVATTVQLHTKSLWVVGVKGTLKVVEGSGTVGADGQVAGRLVIDAGSIDTGNRRRDEHLRSADFFEVDKHPTITYVVTGATMLGPTNQGPDQARVTGTLEVHGVTRPLDVVATLTEVTPDRATITADAAGIDRRDWGLTWAKMGARTINRVIVRAVFTKAA